MTKLVESTAAKLGAVVPPSGQAALYTVKVYVRARPSASEIEVLALAAAEMPVSVAERLERQVAALKIDGTTPTPSNESVVKLALSKANGSAELTTPMSTVERRL